MRARVRVSKSKYDHLLENDKDYSNKNNKWHRDKLMDVSFHLGWIHRKCLPSLLSIAVSGYLGNGWNGEEGGGKPCALEKFGWDQPGGENNLVKYFRPTAGPELTRRGASSLFGNIYPFINLQSFFRCDHASLYEGLSVRGPSVRNAFFSNRGIWVETAHKS